jgi:hypothetical protein
MRKIISILILFFEISTSILYGNYKKNKFFDFSSVDAFFKVEEMLSNNIMPAYWIWDDMFQTKGYQWFGGQWSTGIIKEQMCNAFYKPDSGNINRILSLEIKKDLSNQGDLLSKITLMNFLEIKANMPELKKFRNSLNRLNEEQIYEKANQLLRDFLIIPIDSKIETPKVAFAFFEPDAYNKEKGILMDFNQVFMNGQDAFIRILSHEIYHAYRRKFENIKFIWLNDFTFQIDRLHNEGIADLLSKPSFDLKGSFLPQPVVDIYKDAFENTPKKLEKMDSIVVLYAAGKISISELNKNMADYFLFGGHPNGYYMTQLIIQQGLTEELKSSFYNPIAFLKLYNRAARAGNDYVFSDEFISYLNSLEKMYFN